jgi:hypothetical protein
VVSKPEVYCPTRLPPGSPGAFVNGDEVAHRRHHETSAFCIAWHHLAAMRVIHLLLIVIFMCSASAPGADQLLARDDFDAYAVAAITAVDPGPSAQNLGSGWDVGSGWVLTQSTSAAGAEIADLTILAGTGTAPGRHLHTLGTGASQIGFIGRRLGAAITSSDAGPVWIAFMLKADNLQSTADTATVQDNSIQLFNGGWTGSASLSLNTSGARTNIKISSLSSNYKIRWRLDASDDPANLSNPADDTQAHLVVLRFDGSSARVWFDPALGATEPSTASAFTSIAHAPVTFDRIVFATAGGTASFRIDDLAVGTSWISVTDPTMPMVSASSPNSGSTLGGATLTISGSNFGADTTVTVGGVAATAVAVQGSTGVTARVPAASSAGWVDVVVASGGRSVLLAQAFRYDAPSATTPGPVVFPSISGVPQPGQVLTASPGSWTPTQTSFHYQWQRADDAFGTNALGIGTDSPTYTVATGDLAKFLRVIVTPAGATTNAASDWLQSAYPKPTAAQLSAYSAAGPKGGCGFGLGASALLAGSLLRIRRRG